MSRHARGHLVQFVEPLDPEKLINVNVPVVTLGGLRVVGQKVQLRRAFLGVQDNGVALEFNIKVLLGAGDDVTPEGFGLSPGGGQKDFVPPFQGGVLKRLLGEVPGGPDLPDLRYMRMRWNRSSCMAVWYSK